MKKHSLILFIISALIIFSSCQSVYVTPAPPETTVSPDIDDGEEYFTTGSVYRYMMQGREDGSFYEGSWYYPEIRKYRFEKRTENSIRRGSVYICHIVKYNAATGTVSSACLSPSCSHSPDSDCVMVQIESGGSMLYIQNIVGDWMLITKYNYDTIIGQTCSLISYNLKTGESFDIYSEGMDGESMVNWSGGTPYGGKLYMTKHVLDYSETDFDPSGNSPLSDYEPKTVTVAYEYDLDKGTHKELFELPAGWGIRSFSNKRLLVISDTNEIYTCNFDGTNMAKADVLDFSPHNMIGTYAYGFLDNGFDLYDIKTNTQKRVTVDKFTLYQNCILTDSGIIYNTFTTVDEWKQMIKGTYDYLDEHGDSSIYQYQAMCDAVKYKGTAQLWRSDHDGSNLELVFEKENAVIKYLYGNDRYIYGYATFGDPSTYAELPAENEGRCVIDLETGEFITIPYLDTVLPEGYWLDEDIEEEE